MSAGRWTAADMPDQSGRTAVVTAADSSLGEVTARGLARAGARVVVACRDEGRGEAAARRIRAAAPDADVDVDVEQLDLADFASVRAFPAHRRRASKGLDMLVENAGAW